MAGAAAPQGVVAGGGMDAALAGEKAKALTAGDFPGSPAAEPFVGLNARATTHGPPPPGELLDVSPPAIRRI